MFDYTDYRHKVVNSDQSDAVTFNSTVDGTGNSFLSVQTNLQHDVQNVRLQHVCML